MTRTRESTRGGRQNALRGSGRPATSDQHRKRSAEVVRRTCDDAKRPAWQPKMGSVALHHGHRVGTETTPQILRSPSMQLHGDDMRTSRDQRLGQRTVPAPMSSTSSPGRTAASATSRVAHSSRSGCHPQARPGRPEADIANRHEEATHVGHATEGGERPPSHFQAGARGDAVCWTAASAPSSLAARR